MSVNLGEGLGVRVGCRKETRMAVGAKALSGKEREKEGGRKAEK